MRKAHQKRHVDREIEPDVLAHYQEVAVDGTLRSVIGYIKEAVRDFLNQPQSKELENLLQTTITKTGKGPLQDAIIREVIRKHEKGLRTTMARTFHQRYRQMRSMDPMEACGIILQEKLFSLVPNAATRVMQGKASPVLPDARAMAALDMFENEHVNINKNKGTALIRVLRSTIAPAGIHDLKDLEDMYEAVRWKEPEILKFLFANFKKLKEKIDDEGIFLARFDQYEKGVLTELFEAQKRADQFDPEMEPSRYFAEALPVSCVLRDALTNELLATTICTIPPLNPKKGTPYWQQMEDTLMKWPEEKREEMRKQFESGKVGMLFLVAGKVRFAPALSMYLCIQKIIKLRPDLEYMWSFYLQNLEMIILKHFADNTAAVRDPPRKPIQPMGNTRSAPLLYDCGFESEGIFQAKKHDGQNPERIIFPMNIRDDFLHLHMDVGLDASWQLVIATVSALQNRSRKRIENLLLQNDINPHELDACLAKLLAHQTMPNLTGAALLGNPRQG